MTEADRKRAAKAFAEYWKDRGDEKSDSQSCIDVKGTVELNAQNGNLFEIDTSLSN